MYDLRQCWFSQATEGEDELDFGDDEADAIDWTPNTDTVRLKAKASFLNYSEGTTTSSNPHARSASSLGTSSNNAGEDEFWQACLEAEKRHRHDMRNWHMTEQEATDRSYLWSIRKVSSFLETAMIDVLTFILQIVTEQQSR